MAGDWSPTGSSISSMPLSPAMSFLNSFYANANAAPPHGVYVEGDQVGEWQLMRQIGRGAFSRVFEAASTQPSSSRTSLSSTRGSVGVSSSSPAPGLPRRVAIKVIRKAEEDVKCGEGKVSAATTERSNASSLRSSRSSISSPTLPAGVAAAMARRFSDATASASASAAAAAATATSISPSPTGVAPATPCTEEDLEAILSNLDRETSIWATLDHPHILGLYDMLDLDDAVFIVSELARGGSLLEYINKRRMTARGVVSSSSVSSVCGGANWGIPAVASTSRPPLSEHEARGIFSQVADAVRYLHCVAGVVHRDIKLENVLLITPLPSRLLTPGSSRPSSAASLPRYQRASSFVVASSSSPRCSAVDDYAGAHGTRFDSLQRPERGGGSAASSAAVSAAAASASASAAAIANGALSTLSSSSPTTGTAVDVSKPTIDDFEEDDQCSAADVALSPGPSPTKSQMPFSAQHYTITSTSTSAAAVAVAATATGGEGGGGVSMMDLEDDEDELWMPVCKLADFGLSDWINPHPLQQPATKAKSSSRCSGTQDNDDDDDMDAACMGSLQYCAPEDLRPPYPKSPSSDIWALGCVLYALLTGSLPFNDDFLPRLQMLIANGRYDVSKLERCGVSKTAKDLVAGMLKVKAEERLTILQVCEHPWLLG